MKILIHALGANMGGAMRHLTNFLPALAQYDANHEYDVLVREGIPDIALAGNVRLVRMGGRQDASSRRCLHRQEDHRPAQAQAATVRGNLDKT